MQSHAPTRFLHRLPRTTTGDYHLAGSTWRGTEFADRERLNLHIPDHPLGYLMLEIAASHRVEGGFRWEWSAKLAKGVYATHADHADTPEAAAAAALAYSPDVVQDEISGHEWLRMSPTRWVTHFDGEQADVRKDVCSAGFRWARNCAAAAKVAALFGPVCELRGTADTPELAMLAAEHAPADLRRACAEFVVATRPATPEQ